MYMYIYIYICIYIHMCVCVCLCERHEGAPRTCAWRSPGSVARVSGAPPRAPPGTGEGSSLGRTPHRPLAGTEAGLRLREYCVFIAGRQTGGSADGRLTSCRHPGMQRSGRRAAGQSTGGHLAYTADGPADSHRSGTQAIQQGATSPTLRTYRRPASTGEGRGAGRTGGRPLL